MIDSTHIVAAMSAGTVFTCATCEKYWWGVERGLPHCKAAAEGKACGGPLSGGTYPEYEGPLKGALKEWCFVCGARSTRLAIPKKGGGSAVGVCSKHVDVLKSYSKPGERPQSIKEHKDVEVTK